MDAPTSSAKSGVVDKRAFKNNRSGSGLSRRASLGSISMTDASLSDDQEDVSEPNTPLSADGDLVDHRFLSRNTTFGASAITSGQMGNTVQEEGVIHGHTAAQETKIGDTAPYCEQNIEDERQDESNPAYDSAVSAIVGQSILLQTPWAIDDLVEGKQDWTTAIVPQESRSSYEENDRGSKAKVGILRRIQQGMLTKP